MTSKDELRLQVGHKLHDYGVRGQDNDYLTDYILNLLEGEKQKNPHYPTIIDRQITVLVEMFRQYIPPKDFDQLYQRVIDVQTELQQQYATLNKEPNKGEDVDE